MLKILNTANETVAILQNVVSPIISEGINREFTLEFSTVIDNDKSNYVNYLYKAEAEDNYFNIVYTEEERTREGLYIKAQCEHVSYDLISASLTSGFTATGLFSAVATLLFAGTAFTVGTVQTTASITVNITSSTNKSSVLKQLATLYGGELKFDKYAVSLLTQRGANRGVQFRYRKNLIGARKITDNRQSVAGVPRVSYDVSVAELEFEQGYMSSGANALEHYELGDTITVFDDGLSLNTPLRIVKESHNVNQRMQGQVEIGNFVDDLFGTLSSMQSSIIIVDNNYASWNSTVTNFDTRNDRISTAPANPVISASGSAVDHAINTDGSSDISLEWAFTGSGDAYDIDGFVVMLRSSTSSAAYTFGTTPAEEHVMSVTRDKLAAIFEGVPTDKYYTFGVKAYRMVDQDINATGIIYSSVVQPSLAAENPYRPSANVEFAGNIINTINGVAVSTVTSATDLLNNVVANERLGAQVVGFKASSVRYKQNGTQVLANLPRYETGRFGSAVMIEEGKNNVLSNPLDWTSYTAKSAGTTPTADDAVYAPYVIAADKIVMTGNDYIWKSTPVGSAITGQTWKFSASVYVSAPTSIFIAMTDNVTWAEGWIEKISLSAGWNQISVTRTFGATVSTNVNCLLLSYDLSVNAAAGGSGKGASAVGAITFWVLWSELVQNPKSYNTSFANGSRTAETMVVPTSGNFAKGSATVEITYIPKIDDAASKFSVLWYNYIDANNYYYITKNQTTGYLSAHVVSGGVDYSITDNSVLAVDSVNSIMFAMNGTHMWLCNNGVQIGTDTAYTEPIGTLPTFMYIGSNYLGTNQCNGLIDDVRYSSVARTAASHATAYSSGDPLAVDENTSLKQDFDTSLRQTTRNHASRPQGVFMIADNNTTYDKSRATHIIPTGWTTAQIVFNQAISELPAGGGSIVGMDGTAYVDNNIIVPSNVTLDLGTMTIKATASINIITNSNQVGGNTNIIVKNGTLDGDSVALSGIRFENVSDSKILNVIAQNFVEEALNLITCSKNVIADNICKANAEAGITLNGCSDNVVNSNVCTGNTNEGIRLITSSYNNTVTGNTCSNNNYPGIYLYNVANKNTITGNICSDNASPGILIQTSESNSINGNTCQSNTSSGLKLIASSANNITNNIVIDNDYDGIYLYNGSDDNNIIGNVCSQNSLGSNNVYNNISLETDCDRNNIQDNICRKGVQANKANYGVEIVSATCDANVVTNNDLLTSGDTAPISDGGTGTVTAAGNRVA